MERQTAFSGDQETLTRASTEGLQARRHRKNRVTSHDWTSLFVRDWGDGPALVLMAGDLDSPAAQASRSCHQYHANPPIVL